MSFDRKEKIFIISKGSRRSKDVQCTHIVWDFLTPPFRDHFDNVLSSFSPKNFAKNDIGSIAIITGWCRMHVFSCFKSNADVDQEKADYLR